MGDGENLGAPDTREQEGDGASLSLFDNTPDALLLSSPLPRPSSAPTSKRSTTPLHVHPPISDDDLLQVRAKRLLDLLTLLGWWHPLRSSLSLLSAGAGGGRECSSVAGSVVSPSTTTSDIILRSCSYSAGAC